MFRKKTCRSWFKRHIISNHHVFGCFWCCKMALWSNFPSIPNLMLACVLYESFQGGSRWCRSHRAQLLQSNHAEGVLGAVNRCEQRQAMPSACCVMTCYVVFPLQQSRKSDWPRCPCGRVRFCRSLPASFCLFMTFMRLVSDFVFPYRWLIQYLFASNLWFFQNAEAPYIVPTWRLRECGNASFTAFKVIGRRLQRLPKSGRPFRSFQCSMVR